MGIPPRRWDGKGRSHPQRKANNLLCLGRGAGGGEPGGDTPLSHSPSFVLTLTQGFIGSISSPRAPAKNPIFLSECPYTVVF